jgi:hypothetical protein
MTGKMALVRKAARNCNLGNWKISFDKKVFSSVNTSIEQIAVRARSLRLFKRAGKMEY